MARTALPLLLTLTYQAYWRGNYGSGVRETPLFRLRQRLRETGRARPALEPTWGLC